MCGIFGIMNYDQYNLNLDPIVKSLAEESAIRGTDATGIAYVKDGAVYIRKDAVSAYHASFSYSIPYQSRAVMGHTRLATSGNKNMNYNNHPFPGKVHGHAFALAHNGIIYNTTELKNKYHLPYTKIMTDSYIAVRLIEHKDELSLDSIKFMAENVSGQFTFTLLDDEETLYLVKGDSPLNIMHFKAEKVIVYASTFEILTRAIMGTTLEAKFKDHLTGSKPGSVELIEPKEGDIVVIKKDGTITAHKFKYTERVSYYYYDREWYTGANYNGYGGYTTTEYRTGYVWNRTTGKWEPPAADAKTDTKALTDGKGNKLDTTSASTAPGRVIYSGKFKGKKGGKHCTTNVRVVNGIDEQTRFSKKKQVKKLVTRIDEAIIKGTPSKEAIDAIIRQWRKDYMENTKFSFTSDGWACRAPEKSDLEAEIKEANDKHKLEISADNADLVDNKGISYTADTLRKAVDKFNNNNKQYTMVETSKGIFKIVPKGDVLPGLKKVRKEVKRAIRQDAVDKPADAWLNISNSHELSDDEKRELCKKALENKLKEHDEVITKLDEKMEDEAVHCLTEIKDSDIKDINRCVVCEEPMEKCMAGKCDNIKINRDTPPNATYKKGAYEIPGDDDNTACGQPATCCDDCLADHGGECRAAGETDSDEGYGHNYMISYVCNNCGIVFDEYESTPPEDVVCTDCGSDDLTPCHADGSIDYDRMLTRNKKLKEKYSELGEQLGIDTDTGEKEEASDEGGRLS